MLDLDALEILDTAMPVNSDNAPTREHLRVVEAPADDTPRCPHLARMSAE
ncbi:MAG: hypothetical protein AAGL98_15475 [Planctomycetota bacterium]